MTRVREGWTFSSSLHPRELNRITSSWATQINNLVVFSSKMMGKMTAIIYSKRTRQLRTSTMTINSSFSSILRKTKRRSGRHLSPLRRDSQLISLWVKEVTLLHLVFLHADLIKCPMPAYSAGVPTIALFHKGLFRMHIFSQVVVTMMMRKTAACSLRMSALRSMTHKWAKDHQISLWEIMAFLRMIALNWHLMDQSPLRLPIRAKMGALLGR